MDFLGSIFVITCGAPRHATTDNKFRISSLLTKYSVLRVKVLDIKEIDDGRITRDEFKSLNTAGIMEYMKTLREEHPRFRDRYSEQIWLKQGATSDRIMRELREK